MSRWPAEGLSVSIAANGVAVIVKVQRSASISRSASSGSQMSCSTSLLPSIIAWRKPHRKPVPWPSGEGAHTTSLLVSPSIDAMIRLPKIMVLWLCITPLGFDSVPDVKMIAEMSSPAKLHSGSGAREALLRSE